MFFKVFIVLCLAAVSQAGLLAPAVSYSAYPYNSYPAQPAITSQQSNIYRSAFNLGQVSTYSKSIDTPFSSVRKADIRVSNPGVAVAAPAYSAYHGYAASPYVAAPLAAAPVARVATGGLLGVAYSAAPVVSHMTYSSPIGLSYSW